MAKPTNKERINRWLTPEGHEKQEKIIEGLEKLLLL